MKVLIDIDADEYSRLKVVDQMGMGSAAIRIILAGEILPEGYEKEERDRLAKVFSEDK